jgi:hypothetical protein
MAVLIACAIGVAIGLLAVWSSARAAITVAIAVIKDGRVELTRGGLSPRVLDDLRDIASRPRIKSATLRIVRQKERARVEVRGHVSDPQLQRIRNVVGSAPLAQLMKAGRK